jgi:hypothetical protein
MPIFISEENVFYDGRSGPTNLSNIRSIAPTLPISPIYNSQFHLPGVSALQIPG